MTDAHQVVLMLGKLELPGPECQGLEMLMCLKAGLEMAGSCPLQHHQALKPLVRKM